MSELDGIIVGADANQEWLLPWWWNHFTRHNQLPVAFVDFGCSDEKKKWCAERGKLISLIDLSDWVKDAVEVDEALRERWETRYGDHFWQYRKAWFKKPIACLKSPFQRSLWMDLDCEVLQSVQPLLDGCNHPSGIALAFDRASLGTPPIYNSGVIAFRKGAWVIEEWARQSLERNGEFRGDQDLLSQIIFDAKLTIQEWPAIYNWHVGYGLEPKAVIDHWLGDRGKAALRIQIE